MSTIKQASGAILFWMNRSGFRGVTLPWAVYIHPTRINDSALIRHEMVHVEQMRRDGILGFFARYLWWSVRYGYEDNPYEVEARRISGVR